MYRSATFKSHAALFFLLFLAVSAAAQSSAPEPSEVFDIRSYMVLASDRSGDPAATRPLPQSLAGVAEAIRRDHGFQNFSLIETATGRLSSGGNLDSRGVADIRVGTVTGFPSYFEFRITDVQSENANARPRIRIGTFRSGLRLPVRSIANPQGGPGVNYETVFHSNQRVLVLSGIPTVIGSFSFPNAAGTVFIVLTVTRVSD
ncbi:MAG: hypothetical protein QUS14_08035 [Pyrinomonadaceae bacterium]|nr:hypothetical protein [Pyrinomonadaceae bacterium]